MGNFGGFRPLRAILRKWIGLGRPLSHFISRLDTSIFSHSQFRHESAVELVPTAGHPFLPRLAACSDKSHLLELAGFMFSPVITKLYGDGWTHNPSNTRHDIPTIDTLSFIHQCLDADSGLRVPINDGPLYWSCTSISWQDRGVDV